MVFDRKKLGRLNDMHINVFIEKDTSMNEILNDNKKDPQEADMSKQSSIDETWQLLQQSVSQCTRCDLSATRTQTVFGVGNTDAEWMLVGEAPGAEEDLKGEPFVGRAGKLLDSMLEAIQLDRSTVYIANIVKCRPPNNRNPRPEEAEQCLDYLYQQIAYVKPHIILALGAVAASNLLNTKTPVGQLRGEQHILPNTDIPLVVTYHPAYLLRSPNQKRSAWEDLQLACRVVGKDIEQET